MPSAPLTLAACSRTAECRRRDEERLSQLRTKNGFYLRLANRVRYGAEQAPLRGPVNQPGTARDVEVTSFNIPWLYRGACGLIPQIGQISQTIIDLVRS